MRLLELEMQAFGTFKNKVIIDFTEFDQSSLFLLAGPTGSGKTTIFDAVTYALYGSASGSDRSNNSLKSDFVGEETKCYVRLVFEIDQKTVEITRSPSQKAIGVRGGVINQQAKVALVIDSEGIKGNKTELDKYIKDLVGLDVNQFKQIVMLPQGEFQKFLISNSSDKEGILREIFRTDFILDFEEKIKDEAKKYKDKNAELEAKLNGLLDTVDTNNNLDLNQAIETKDYDQIVDLLDHLNQADQKVLEDLERDLKEAENQGHKIDTYIKNLDKLDKYTQNKKKLSDQKSDIENLKVNIKLAGQAKDLKQVDLQITGFKNKRSENEKNLKEYAEHKEEVDHNLETVKKDLAEHQEQVNQLDGLEEQKSAFNNEMTLWENIESSDKKIAKYKKSIKTKQDTVEKSKENKKHLAEALKELQDQLEKVPGMRDKASKIGDQIAELQDTKRELNQKVDRLKAIEKSQQSLAGEQTKAEDQEKQVEKLAETAKDLSQKYYGNLAGVLADELKDDQPCPVCGSTHHPNKANHQDREVSRDEFLAADEKVGEAKRALDVIELNIRNLDENIKDELAKEEVDENDLEVTIKDLSEQGKKVTQDLKNLETEREKLQKELAKEEKWRKKQEELNRENHNLDIKVETSKSEINSFKEQIDSLEKEKAEKQAKLTVDSKEELAGKIQKLSKQIKDIRQQNDALKEKQSKLEKEQASVDSNIQSTKKSLKQNEEDIKTQQGNFDKLIEKYNFEGDYKAHLATELDLSDWEKAVNDYNKQVIQTDENLKSAEENLPDEADRKSLEEYKADKDTLQQKTKEQKTKRDQINNRFAANTKAKEKVSQNLSDQKKVLEKGALYKELSNLATGNDTINNKISFERYVLGIYFDDIILAANERLRQMTDNRYELRRKIDGFSGNKGHGLDLNVFDEHTGKEREVKTLSGGEKFKAALSLALGLSDVVQNQQGGIEVNTLFVDEGFGTLDADSLDQALEVLMELNASGRLIGIISHVEELKQRIPSKIIVEKGTDGSQIKIEK